MYFLKGFLLPVFLFIFVFFIAVVLLLFTFFCIGLLNVYDWLEDKSSVLAFFFVCFCICCGCGLLYSLFVEGSFIRGLLSLVRDLLKSYFDFLYDFYPWLEDFLKAFSLADNG